MHCKNSIPDLHGYGDVTSSLLPTYRRQDRSIPEHVGFQFLFLYSQTLPIIERSDDIVTMDFGLSSLIVVNQAVFGLLVKNTGAHASMPN